MADTTPHLARLQLNSPCDQSWDAMVGDDRRRWCGECRLHVHDLSAMTSVEAETLLRESGGRVCVRFVRRADGRILTRDCAESRAEIRARLRRLRVAAAALFGLAGPLGLAACGSGGGAAPPPLGDEGAHVIQADDATAPSMGTPCTPPQAGDGGPDEGPEMGEVEAPPPVDDSDANVIRSDREFIGR